MGAESKTVSSRPTWSFFFYLLDSPAPWSLVRKLAGALQIHLEGPDWDIEPTSLLHLHVVFSRASTIASFWSYDDYQELAVVNPRPDNDVFRFIELAEFSKTEIPESIARAASEVVRHAIVRRLRRLSNEADTSRFRRQASLLVKLNPKWTQVPEVAHLVRAEQVRVLLEKDCPSSSSRLTERRNFTRLFFFREKSRGEDAVRDELAALHPDAALRHWVMARIIACCVADMFDNTSEYLKRGKDGRITDVKVGALTKALALDMKRLPVTYPRGISPHTVETQFLRKGHGRDALIECLNKVVRMPGRDILRNLAPSVSKVTRLAGS